MQVNAQVLVEWRLENGIAVLANNTWKDEPWLWVFIDNEGTFHPFPYRAFKSIWEFKHFIQTGRYQSAKEKR